MIGRQFMASMPRPSAIVTPPQWARLSLSLLAIYLLFHWSASALGSDRGQAGVVVAALVVSAVLAAERLFFTRDIRAAVRRLGAGRPRGPGILAAGIVSIALLAVVPLFAVLTGTSVSLAPGWFWLVPGLFAQAGLAEEILFRAYLFGHLRAGRSFWRAAGLAMIPFAAVHLVMFVTLPWQVALAGVLLAVVLSIPLARLYELGGDTVWAPALLHAVIQGAVKIVVMPDEWLTLFAVVWMGASALLALPVLVVQRGSVRGRRAARERPVGES